MYINNDTLIESGNSLLRGNGFRVNISMLQLWVKSSEGLAKKNTRFAFIAGRHCSSSTVTAGVQQKV